MESCPSSLPSPPPFISRTRSWPMKRRRRRRKGGERGIRKFLEIGYSEEPGGIGTRYTTIWRNSGVGEPRIISSGNEVTRSFDTRTRNTEHFGFQLLLSVTRLSPRWEWEWEWEWSGGASGSGERIYRISFRPILYFRRAKDYLLLSAPSSLLFYPSPPLFPLANFKSFITAASIKIVHPCIGIWNSPTRHLSRYTYNYTIPGRNGIFVYFPCLCISARRSKRSKVINIVRNFSRNRWTKKRVSHDGGNYCKQCTNWIYIFFYRSNPHFSIKSI